MGRIKHVYDDVWRQNYYYVCCPTHEELRKIIKKELNIDLEIKENTEGTFYVLESNGVQIYLIWTKYKKANIICHELMHAVSYGLRHKGLPLSDESEEAYCYLLDFLVRKLVDGEKTTQ